MSEKKKHVYTKKVAPQEKQSVADSIQKHTPSKREETLLRIGTFTIIGTVILVAIIFLISYFSGNSDEEVIPFENYIQITQTELSYLVAPNEIGTYGSFDNFIGDVENYDVVYNEIKNTTFIYILLYRSSDIDQDIQTLVEESQTLEDLVFYVLDLDHPANASFFTNSSLSHLNLTESVTQALITYELDAPDQDYLTIWTRSSDILIDLNKIA